MSDHKKMIKVKVTTAESQLEFQINRKALGQDLFDQVVSTIGLREVWYFGIQYVDKDNNLSFLRPDKKIRHHDFAHGHEYEFKFVVKFYPENVVEDLIQTTTITYFYLQVKNDIMSGKIYCSPETAVLLASYACVVKYGPYNKNTCPKSLSISRIIPSREQFNQTDDQWYARIIAYYEDHKDMSREEAMVNYLQIAQDLEMYGVATFDIKNKAGTPLVLGINANGANIYDPSNLLDPKVGFYWSDVAEISVRDKKFFIKPTDIKSNAFFFTTESAKVNKRIFSLYTGNRALYYRRRNPDSIEVQQMKIQAKEEREMKETERQRLKEERLQRMENEQKLVELNAQMVKKESELEAISLKVSSYQQKINELQQLLDQEQLARADLQKSQQTLAEMNKKLKEETEATAEERQKLIDERDRVQREVEEQRIEIAAKESAKTEAEEYLRRLCEKRDHPSHNNGSGDTVSMDDDSDVKEFEVVANENRTEESRVTEISKNESLQTKLANLRSELDIARDKTKMRNIDHLHEHNVREGNDKYKTLRNIRKGNTMSRVEQYEAM